MTYKKKEWFAYLWAQGIMHPLEQWMAAMHWNNLSLVWHWLCGFSSTGLSPHLHLGQSVGSCSHTTMIFSSPLLLHQVWQLEAVSMQLVFLPIQLWWEQLEVAPVLAHHLPVSPWCWQRQSSLVSSVRCNDCTWWVLPTPALVSFYKMLHISQEQFTGTAIAHIGTANVNVTAWHSNSQEKKNPKLKKIHSTIDFWCKIYHHFGV